MARYCLDPASSFTFSSLALIISGALVAIYQSKTLSYFAEWCRKNENSKLATFLHRNSVTQEVLT